MTIYDDLQIGTNIRNIRTNKGLSQSDLVRELQFSGSDMPQSVLSRIENNQRSINASDLVLIAKLLDVSLDTLFFGNHSNAIQYMQSVTAIPSQSMQPSSQYLLQEGTYGHILHRLRIQANMTQSELVAKIRLRGSTLSQDALSKIENGKRNVKYSDLLRILDALEIPSDAPLSTFFAY